MNNQPWYHQGLKFQCTGCGSCCTGEPGYVWIRRAEMETLANATGLDVAEFEKTFVRSIGRRKSLVELPNGDCVFFDRLTRRCRVYEVRPQQCRTWPFWESNLSTPEDWEQTCKVCPGSGRGLNVPLEQVEARRKSVRV